MSVETLFFFKNLKTVMPVSQTKGVIFIGCRSEKNYQFLNLLRFK